MSKHNIFAYVFKLKSNVVVPHDYSQLREIHYLCVHRDPVAELVQTDPIKVCQHMRIISAGLSWYKRGLTPLSPPDVVWYDGIGYMLIPDASFSGTLFRKKEVSHHEIDGLHLQEVNLDPEKILTCKA
jgi:hypothetical protein